METVFPLVRPERSEIPPSKSVTPVTVKTTGADVKVPKKGGKPVCWKVKELPLPVLNRPVTRV